jgi:hypothetical protein
MNREAEGIIVRSFYKTYLCINENAQCLLYGQGTLVSRVDVSNKKRSKERRRNMKKLLSPTSNRIPVTGNDLNEEDLLLTEMSEFEVKYRAKLMSLSADLIGNTPRQEKQLASEFDLSLEPRQPEKPKPSSAGRKTGSKQVASTIPAKLQKQVLFQPYKSTRPDLLAKLELMVTRGLSEIDKNQDIGPSTNEDSSSKLIEQRFHLFSFVFEKYIEESTLYRKMLEDIYNAYHDYIDVFLSKTFSESDVNTIMEKKEKESEEKLLEADQIHNIKYQIAQETNKLLEKKITHMEIEKLQVETDLLKMKEQFSSVKKEYDELKSSCVTLTSGLSRMEEEHRVFQMNEASRLSDLTHSLASEQKLNEKIER